MRRGRLPGPFWGAATSWQPPVGAKKSGIPGRDAAFAIEEGIELNERYFHCVRAFFALSDFELHFVVFTNLVNEVRYVNEDIRRCCLL